MDTIDLASHDQCVIELNSGRKITAEYRYLSGARDYVVVENTIDANNRKRPGLQKYYRSEIVSITKVPDCLPQRPNGNNRADNDGEHQAVNECNKVPPTIKHLNNDTIVGRMIDLSAKAIYIAQCDEQYHAALRDLESQDVIAVSTENKFGRLDTKKPLLAFATAQNVYLFDTLRIGRVNKDIKRMLSTAEPRKVLFNSAKVNDYFMHAENCQIDMYWDILMSDIVIKQKVQIKDLIECAQQYFDIPDDLSDSSEINYDDRPLSGRAKQLAAFKAILMLKLFWVQNTILQSPLNAKFDQFANIYAQNKDRVDVMTEITSNTYAGVEQISLEFAESFKKSCSLLSANQSL